MKSSGLLTWHADAAVPSAFVDAGSLVLARIGLALVDIDLAASPGETGDTVATVGARGVDTDAVVLTRRSWKKKSRKFVRKNSIVLID